jgi:hypothetical protein
MSTENDTTEAHPTMSTENVTTESMWTCSQQMIAWNSFAGTHTIRIWKNFPVLIREGKDILHRVSLWPWSKPKQQHWIGHNWCNIPLSHQWLLEIHPLDSIRVKSARVTMFLLTKLTILLKTCELAFEHTQRPTLKTTQTNAISTHFPPMIAWITSLGIHTSQFRKISHVSTDESRNVTQNIRILALSTPNHQHWAGHN